MRARLRERLSLLGATAEATCAVAVAVAVGLPASAAARVLLVGSYHGVAGDFASVQAATGAAHAGDWILVRPGDCKEPGDRVPPGALGDDRAGAAVLITTPGIHLRDMDRNAVVLDGTRPGSPRCSAAAADPSPARPTRPATRPGATGSSCSRPTEPGSRTSPSATSSPAATAAAT